MSDPSKPPPQVQAEREQEKERAAGTALGVLAALGCAGYGLIGLVVVALLLLTFVLISAFT